MNINRRHLPLIILVLVGSLCVAGPSAARVAETQMHSEEGQLTAVNLKEASVTVGSQTYAIDDTGSVMESLQAKEIQVSDRVVITYELQGNTKRLVTITKVPDTTTTETDAAK